MKTGNLHEGDSYAKLVIDLKNAILASQRQVFKSANRQLLLLYLHTGRNLSEKIKAEKWGTAIMEKVSRDLQKQIPGLTGFSPRNLRKMRQFYEVYATTSIWPSLTAKLKDFAEVSQGLENVTAIDGFLDISFTHHLLILSKCKTSQHREFYIRNAASEGWSVTLLEHQIDAQLVNNQGKLPNNFEKTLPNNVSPSALHVFRDEYLMEYLAIDADNERAIENSIVTDIRNFLLTMGKGFSFLGNQYRVEVGGSEFFIDLLFYNRNLQCLVAFELKRGVFKPEYVGQLNFYLNGLDSQVRLPHENPSIGIILCREKNNTVVEYSIKNLGNAMGVATFRTTTKMPKSIKDVLPKPEELGRLLGS
ncbi:MAG: PDDEXK nuclease domain-containing protein [Chitinophagaceae bacterium]